MHHWKEQDVGIQFECKHVLAVYRAPTGDFKSHQTKPNHQFQIDWVIIKLR